MANQNIITKIHRKQDNLFKTYRIGAEAEDIFVRNGDREISSAQSLLFKDTPAKTYRYGQSIWSSSMQNYMVLTWKNIIDMVRRDTIDQYLKPGDCIVFPASGNRNFEVHLYVIGINTHNGQPYGQIGKPHIDFCGGSLIQLLSSKDSGYSEDSYTSQTVFNVFSNNGIPYNGNDSTAHFIMNSCFCKDATDYRTSLENSLDNNGDDTYNSDYDGRILNDSVCNKYLKNYLGLPETAAAKKNLYLGSRLSRFPILKNIRGGNDTDITTLTAGLNDLKQLYQGIQTYFSQATGAEWYVNKYLSIYDFLYEDQHRDMRETPMSLSILRHSADISIDTFVQDMTKKYQRGFDSSTALRWHRFSIASNSTSATQPTMAIPSSKKDFRVWLENWSGLREPNELPQDYDKDQFKDFLEILEDIYYLSQHAYKDDSMYKIFSDQENIVLQSRVYCLTEQELFGTNAFSLPRYEQGQSFQYPALTDMSIRKRILTDLGHYKSSNLNTNTIIVPTLSSTEGSDKTVAGMDKDTLCPIEVDITKKISSKLVDTPICFRIEKDASTMN